MAAAATAAAAVQVFQAGKCPARALAYTNRVVVANGAFPGAQHVIVVTPAGADFVFTLTRSDRMVRCGWGGGVGCAAWSAVGRSRLRVGLRERRRPVSWDSMPSSASGRTCRLRISSKFVHSRLLGLVITLGAVCVMVAAVEEAPWQPLMWCCSVCSKLVVSVDFTKRSTTSKVRGLLQRRAPLGRKCRPARPPYSAARPFRSSTTRER